MTPIKPHNPYHRQAAGDRVVTCLLLVLGLLLVGCNGAGKAQGDIPLPEIDGGERRFVPLGVHAVIRVADLPLDQPTDDAWAVINEAVVPTLTHGAWRGNGMRLGVIDREQFDAFAKVMPQPVNMSQTLINQSPHPVPIIETSQLAGDLLFAVDLTRPPMPRQVEEIVGGKNSTLRLLGRIETDDAGRHTLVLIPQHFIPSPFDLIPRNPLVKELDGRVFNELTVRLTLEQDQVAVVDLYWPWPERALQPGEEKRQSELQEESQTQVEQQEKRDSPYLLPRSDDPAAPPPHIRQPEVVKAGENKPNNDKDKPADKEQTTKPDTTGTPPRVERIAPPLLTNFGSTLLTGTRIRQPVRRVLLISIISPDVPDSEPAQGDAP